MRKAQISNKLEEDHKPFTPRRSPPPVEQEAEMQLKENIEIKPAIVEERSSKVEA